MYLAYDNESVSATLGWASGARRAGRPCRAATVNRLRAAAIERYLAANLADPALCARTAAPALGMSVRSLHLALEHTGENFSQLLQRLRLEACCAQLRHAADNSVADIAFACGFNSLSSFYRGFRRLWGTCPNDLRREAA